MLTMAACSGASGDASGIPTKTADALVETINHTACVDYSNASEELGHLLQRTRTPRFLMARVVATETKRVQRAADRAVGNVQDAITQGLAAMHQLQDSLNTERDPTKLLDAYQTYYAADHAVSEACD
jgi:hypothetical protein